MDDPVADVRDWATFALGDTEGADDVASRSALLERLDDEDRSVSGEALIALARQGDERALPSVLDRLRHEDTVDEEVIEAARELGHPHVLPLLLDLREHAAVIGLDQAVLDQAIASCGGHDDRRHPSADHPTRRFMKD
jgi:HEAT repeat protein